MSQKDLEQAFSLIKENFSADEIDFSGKQKLETISNAEKSLGVKFPNTYKTFLQKYGCGGIGGFEIYGLIKDEDFNKINIPFVAVPNAVWVTLKENKEYKHPLYLVIIYNLDEVLYCLDTSQMNDEGECPVVVWPIGVYETPPKLEVEAKDFGEFLLKMVKEAIQEKNEE